MVAIDENSNWGWKEKDGCEKHCTNRSTRLDVLALREKRGVLEDSKIRALVVGLWAMLSFNVWHIVRTK